MVSFSEALSSCPPSNHHQELLWKTTAPPRILAFAWLVLRGSILTMDNLQRHNVIVVNACPLCLANEKTMDHLLLNCWGAKEIWNSFFKSFDYSWILPDSILLLFNSWWSIFSGILFEVWSSSLPQIATGSFYGRLRLLLKFLLSLRWFEGTSLPIDNLQMCNMIVVNACT